MIEGKIVDKVGFTVQVGEQGIGCECHVVAVHGYNVAFTADSLFTNLYCEADFIHDFTFDHRSSGNVVERAYSDGLCLSLDHHRDASHENLFTEFYAETAHIKKCGAPHFFMWAVSA